jgi:chromosome segregation ATPase
MAEEQKKQRPGQAYHPILSARIPYKLKLKIEEDAYTRQFALQQYTRMLLEKAYEECGGIEGMNALLEQAKNEEDAEKKLKSYEEALEREQKQRQEAEKKADRLQKEKNEQADKAKGESSDKSKLQTRISELEAELEKVQQDLEAMKQEKEKLEKRLKNANKWRKDRKEKGWMDGPSVPEKDW